VSKLKRKERASPCRLFQKALLCAAKKGVEWSGRFTSPAKASGDRGASKLLSPTSIRIRTAASFLVFSAARKNDKPIHISAFGRR